MSLMKKIIFRYEYFLISSISYLRKSWKIKGAFLQELSTFKPDEGSVCGSELETSEIILTQFVIETF